MKHFIVLCFFVITLLSCGDDSSQLDLNISLAYNDDPLVMTQGYEYPDGRLVKFNRVSFFISDLTVSDGIESQQLIDARQINLTQSHTDLQGAMEGLNILSESINFSNINQLNFNLGLTPEQNGLTPTDYPNSSDLSNSAEYWLGWSSYVFAKIEGLIDLDNDG